MQLSGLTLTSPTVQLSGTWLTEIGQKLGLPPVRASRNRGKDADLPSCAQWPHCVRPEGYYLGAYVPGGNGSRVTATLSLEQELQRLLKKWSKQEILDVLHDL